MFQEIYMHDVDAFEKACAMSENNPQPLITSGSKSKEKMDQKQEKMVLLLCFGCYNTLR